MKVTVPKLAPNVIHLWELDLDHFIFNDVLSEDERARAAKFRFDHLRKRFTSGRTALRLLIAGYLNANPEKIEFCYGSAGKPMIPGAPISFNLAHSGSHALLAFTEKGFLGVDVEEARQIEDMESVAEFSFSPGEFQRWRALPAEEKVRAFYRCWTRKEAYLKATGEGIAERLKKFEVAFESGEPPRILKGVEEAWTLADVGREPTYAAAVAYEGAGRVIEPYSLASI